MNARAGFVLPLVVVAGVLLASLVMTFHFVSASDYRAMGRLERSIQASLLADLASDEVAVKVAAIRYGPNDPAKPQWVGKMLEELALARKNNAQPPFKVNQTASFSMNDLSQTQKAVQKTAGLVEITAVDGKLGPFNLTSPGGVGALVYADPAYGDAARDPRAWDLRGPLAIKVMVAGSRSSLEFSQEYQRGQELLITDTTAPAWQHALFSFLPPPTEPYMFTDLNVGGKLEVHTNIDATGVDHARLFVRGPLVLLPEEAPSVTADRPHLPKGKGNAPVGLPVQGSPNVARPGPSWPDGEYKNYLAMVPGPTMMIHPSATVGALDSAMGGISDVFEDAVGVFEPKRPFEARSTSRLVTKTFTFNITVSTGIRFPSEIELPVKVPDIDWTLNGVSLALANNYGTPGATFNTLDRDAVSTFPSGAYLHAPLPADKQGFRIADPPNAKAGKCYRGVKLTPGRDPEPWNGQIIPEGQTVTMEPAARPNQPLAANAGVFSLLGVARFESRTILALPIMQFTLWMMDRYIDTLTGLKAWLKPHAERNKVNAAIQTLAHLRLDTNLKFLARRFAADAKTAWAAPPANLSANEVRNRLAAKDAVLAPFGAYFWDGQLWAPSGLLARAQRELTQPLLTGAQAEQALLDLLPNINTPGVRDRELTYESAVNRVDSTWGGEVLPTEQPTTPSLSSEMRDWICGDRQKKLLDLVMPGGVASAPQALDQLLALVQPNVRGIGSLELTNGKRPKGALGDFLSPPGAPANSAGLDRDFPTGYFPPKYREWDRIVTRRYPDMLSYINAEKNGTVLELRGAVLVEKMNHTQGFTYRGRGILVCGTPDDRNDSKCVLDGPIGPEGNDPKNMLVIVHRTTPELLKTGKPPPLYIGKKVMASVYSDSGVRPAQGTTEIIGNLVTGLLNKNQQNGDVAVHYHKGLLDAPADKIADRWTVEMSGEVTSTQPPSN